MIIWLSMTFLDQWKFRQLDFIIFTITTIWREIIIIAIIFIMWKAVLFFGTLRILNHQWNLKWAESRLLFALFLNIWCFDLAEFNQRWAALPKNYVFNFIFIFKTCIDWIFIGVLRCHRISIGTKIRKNR